MSLLLILLICACAPRPREISRIALLAPFEGRYREVGYNALYAAKLALQEWDTGDYLELLPVDDGGTVASARNRAHALAGDPLVKAVVVLGYAATDAETLRAFADLPVLVAGHWGAQPETETVFMLANPALDETLTAPPRVDVVEAAELEAPLMGGEVFALEQFMHLRSDVRDIQIASSGSLPDAAFRDQYLTTGQFVPEPTLLATLTYQAFTTLLGGLQIYRMDGSPPETASRAAIAFILNISTFENGYWSNASINLYQYDAMCVQRGGEMCLVPVDRP